MQNMLFKIGKCGGLYSGDYGMWWREADDGAAKFLGRTSQKDACKKLCDHQVNALGMGVCGFKKDHEECYYCSGCGIEDYEYRFGGGDQNHLASNCH